MSDFSRLRNIYWFIRYNWRNKVVKRRYYRYALKEKKRLHEAGVDAEYLRLLCRLLSKRHCEHALRRLQAYQKQNGITY